MKSSLGEQIFDCLVIGAGQSGLATGYHLQQAGLNFIILEARPEITGSYASYYDSLKLFTPTQFSQLPNFRSRFHRSHYPSKDEFILYLQDYSRHFGFPVQTSTEVTSIEKREGTFLVKAGKESFLAKTIIDASGPFCQPYIPIYPNQNAFQGQILHSFYYKNPKGLEHKRVVIIGAGNSAVQIAMELKEVAQVTIAVKKKLKWVSQKILGADIHWWMHTFGIDIYPLKSKPKGGIPVIDTGFYRQVIKNGEIDIRHMIKAFTTNGVIWDNDETEMVDVVIFATGYHPRFAWLEALNAMDDQERVLHSNGVSNKVPGLFFTGMFLQRNAASGNIRGASFDAEYVVRRAMSFLGRNSQSAKKDLRQVALKQWLRK